MIYADSEIPFNVYLEHVFTFNRHNSSCSKHVSELSKLSKLSLCSEFLFIETVSPAIHFKCVWGWVCCCTWPPFFSSLCRIFSSSRPLTFHLILTRVTKYNRVWSAALLYACLWEISSLCFCSCKKPGANKHSFFLHLKAFLTGALFKFRQGLLSWGPS